LVIIQGEGGVGEASPFRCHLAVGVVGGVGEGIVGKLNGGGASMAVERGRGDFARRVGGGACLLAAYSGGKNCARKAGEERLFFHAFKSYLIRLFVYENQRKSP